MKRTFALPVLLLAALTFVVAGCGDTDEVPADAVAVVDGTPITKAELDGLIARVRTSYTAQKRDFPKAGTAQYQSLQSQAVAYLVQREEYAREAEELGVEVTDAQVAKRIDEVLKESFGGDQKAFDKQLAEQGYTADTFREDVAAQLESEGIFEKVTGAVKVSDADVKAHYDQNKTQYSVAPSREVRHILVKTKAQADEIRRQLVGGADFAAIAKKSSLDPGSKDQGGKLTISKGQTVPPFDKAAFSLGVDELSQPVQTEFGWHVLQPLSAATKGSVTPLAKVQDQIRSELAEEKKNTAITQWAEKTQKDWEDRVTYAVGYEPPETSADDATDAG